MLEYLNRGQVVCGCGWLLSSWKKEKERFELNGYRRSHCQEPLAGASRIFTGITPFVSGGEVEGIESE